MQNYNKIKIDNLNSIKMNNTEAKIEQTKWKLLYVVPWMLLLLKHTSSSAMTTEWELMEWWGYLEINKLMFLLIILSCVGNSYSNNNNNNNSTMAHKEDNNSKYNNGQWMGGKKEKK